MAAETLAEERVDYRAVYRGFADNFLAPSPTYGRFLGQIVLVQRSALSCEVEGGLWVVPPRSHERGPAFRREIAHWRSLISHSRLAVFVSCASGLGGVCS